MAKGTSFKRVVVKEDSKTNLRAAKVHPVTLPNGSKVVVLGHLYYPYHDRSLVERVLQYLRDTKPDLVILAGGIVSEEAFKSLYDEEDNYLHDFDEVPEVAEAKNQGLFEDMVLALGKTCGDFVKQFAEASGGHVVYIPSWTHLSMPNEVRLMEYVQAKKRYLDGWMSSHPDGDVVSDPTKPLPKKLDELLGLNGLANVTVTRYGAGVKINKDVLVMIGDFRRADAGTSSFEEWKRRGVSIIRTFDGKVASGYMTTPKNTLPGLQLNHWQFHEVGYLWDPVLMAHLRDYDKRNPGFWTGEIVEGVVYGRSIPVLRGNDGRRSFVVNGKPYTENEPGATFDGDEIVIKK